MTDYIPLLIGVNDFKSRAWNSTLSIFIDVDTFITPVSHIQKWMPRVI